MRRIYSRCFAQVFRQCLEGLDFVDPRQMSHAIRIAGIQLRPFASLELGIASRKVQDRPVHLSIEQQISVRHFNSAQVVEFVGLPKQIEGPRGRATRHNRLCIANVTKDTFATPAYTARQWDYARAAGRAQVATPQVIVNGRGAVVGSNAAQLAAAIRGNARGPDGPAIGREGSKIVIGGAAGAKAATVWFVRYDPRTLNVAIRAGENDGKTLPHRNIVRSLDALGTWNGAQMAFTIPAATDPNYRSAILVQEGKGGRIIAAGRL